MGLERLFLKQTRRFFPRVALASVLYLGGCTFNVGAPGNRDGGSSSVNVADDSYTNFNSDSNNATNCQFGEDLGLTPVPGGDCDRPEYTDDVSENSGGSSNNSGSGIVYVRAGPDWHIERDECAILYGNIFNDVPPTTSWWTSSVSGEFFETNDRDIFVCPEQTATYTFHATDYNLDSPPEVSDSLIVYVE